ncbi:uncharacterized protein YndB with AHSA1/START domain [Rhizobium aquaticum]|uniref:Uncharacterized protein YndB with AHSA1/START domain n=1 Tax=Rhizobium aquaticum TaxID=1549636 RepID=A0ABV2J1K5_9HYPH
MTITVETKVAADIATVWHAYTTPEDIVAWNAASDDWHTTRATVELHEGGLFSSRMEAKDGSQGFDFAGTYTRIVPYAVIEYAFGERKARVDFVEDADGVTVTVAFDSDGQFPEDMQRAGWQAILDNFKWHVESKRKG